MKNFQSQTRRGFGFGSPHICRRPARSWGAPAAPVRTVTRQLCGHRSTVTPAGSWAFGQPSRSPVDVAVGARQHAGHLADARWGDRSAAQGQGGCPDARGHATDQDSKKAEAPQGQLGQRGREDEGGLGEMRHDLSVREPRFLVIRPCQPFADIVRNPLCCCARVKILRSSPL